MADLGQAVATLSEALEVASQFGTEDELRSATDLVDAIRTRHGFLGETVVVALAGGTGSGKSSLLNAVAGSDVSSVGPIRPTTADPLAWMPANPEPGLSRLLDELGIERRVGHQLDLPLALIDLPDYDSVEVDHRTTVEALISKVDAVVWVVDPQKYSDRALHRDYLLPMVAYQDQFLFILNQQDRLDDPGLKAVLDDFSHRLETEGFTAPRILTAAAAPAAGEPRGIDSFTQAMTNRFEAKRTASLKLVEDLRRGHGLLAGLAGLNDGPVVSVPQVWRETKDRTVDGLVDLVAGPDMAERAEQVGERLATSRAAGPVGRLGALLRRSRLGRALGAESDELAPRQWWAQPGLERVLGDLSRTITDLSVTLGGGLGRQVRERFTPEVLEEDLRSTVEATRSAVGDLGPPRTRRWWSLVGLIQLALFAALVAGLVWLWVDGVDRNEVPWNLILIGGSVVVATVLSWAVKASGRRAGRRSAKAYRAQMEQGLADSVEARIGDSLSEAVAVRDRLAGTLSRLEGEVGEIAAELAGS